jgi:hypothetical protein
VEDCAYLESINCVMSPFEWTENSEEKWEVWKGSCIDGSGGSDTDESELGEDAGDIGAVDGLSGCERANVCVENDCLVDEALEDGVMGTGDESDGTVAAAIGENWYATACFCSLESEEDISEESLGLNIELETEWNCCCGVGGCVRDGTINLCGAEKLSMEDCAGVYRYAGWGNQ